MSHASTTSVACADLVSPHSADVAAAAARPLLVVETLDHSAGSTGQFTYTYAMEAAPGGGTPLFTFCAQAASTDSVQLTYTYRAQAAATDSPSFTFCARPASADAAGARSAAPVAVEGDAVAGTWI